MKIIGICGLGGAGKEMLELIKRIGRENWSDIVFIDKFVSDDNREFRGCKVYTFEEITESYDADALEFIVAVGDVYLREKIYKQIVSAGYGLATLIAPGVYVPDSTKLGQGVIIQANCFISLDSNIADNVMILPNAVIGHDVTIHEHTVIAAQSSISGGAEIGTRTYVAIGCGIKELVKVGDDTIVSMGTVVNKNVESGIIVRGNPVEVFSKNYLKSAFRLNVRK